MTIATLRLLLAPENLKCCHTYTPKHTTVKLSGVTTTKTMEEENAEYPNGHLYWPIH